jgi:hypothetical protein
MHELSGPLLARVIATPAGNGPLGLKLPHRFSYHRFRQRAIFGAREGVCATADHLERTGRIEKEGLPP